MRNKRFVLEILIIALVFGITFVGCDINGNDNGNGVADMSLNGIWTGTEIINWSTGPHWRFCENFMKNGCDFPLCNDCVWIDKTEHGIFESKLELILSDGANFRMSKNGFPYIKGTYSADGSKLIINPSHHSGWNYSFGLMIWMDDLDSTWYTKNEFEAEWLATNDASTSSEQRAIIADIVNDLFATSTSSYSVKGNTLTIANWAFNEGDIEKQTFTKSN